MATRSFDFITGVETSTAPDPVDPTNPEDIMSKGYADDTYTAKAHVYGQVADINALKAIASADRFDDQYCFVAGLDVIYHFDAASTSTPDDDLVVQPTSGTGRWLKAFTGSGGGGGGTGSGLDQLRVKLEQEKQSGFKVDELDESVGISCAFEPQHKAFIGYALENISASDTSIPIVWNPKVYVDADPNTDSTTGWAATAQATNLTTGGSFKIGSNSLSYDKSAGGADALIQYDRTAQNFSAAGYEEMRFWHDTTSITNLTAIVVRIYADTTSNYAEWEITTDITGAAISVSQQYFRLDLTTAPTNTGGTGWDSTKLSRYMDIGVRSSSNGQTYTGMRVDGICFSYAAQHKLGLIANEVTLYDNSNRENIQIGAANDRLDDFVTVSTTTNSYTGGLSGASIAKFVRSSLLFSGGSAYMDDSLSGDILKIQEVRTSRILPETISGNKKIFTQVRSKQEYVVTAVNASVSIEVEDPANDSANLKSGDKFEFHREVFSGSESAYLYQLSRAATGNATHSAGTTTIPMTTTTGIAVGDIVNKRHVAHYASCVGATAAENLASAAIDESATGIRMLGSGVGMIQENTLWGYWPVGGATTGLATKNKVLNGQDLSVVGTLNLQENFMNGHYAASGFTASNYFQISAAASEPISGDSADSTNLLFECWFKDTIGFNGSLRALLGKFTGGSGYVLYANSAANYLQFSDDNGANVNVTGTYTVGAWNHVLFYIDEVTDDCFWVLNGVKSSEFAMSVGDLGGLFNIGAYSGGSGPATGIHIGAVSVRRNLVKPNAGQIAALYNGGVYRSPYDRYLEYVSSVNGLSGQKLSTKAQLTRTTSAVQAHILKHGII